MSTPGSEKSIVPHVRLTWLTPDGKTQEQVLDQGTIVIGRGGDCDIRTQDLLVSRHHARISSDGTSFLVTDLGSNNGTFVNNKRLEAAQTLQDGDILRIGGMKFNFIRPAPPPPPVEEATIEKTLVTPAPAVTPNLEIASGPGEKTHLELVKEKMTIGRAGRGQQWDLMLQDRAVSRPQAQITCQAEGFVLTDLGSANGTLVNGVEISSPYVLKDGDAITFGETVLVFHAGAGMS
jgi:pSer/pThr/pTyr-binding forkhead associated (FHA) protein